MVEVVAPRPAGGNGSSNPALYDRCSSAANRGNLIYVRDARAVLVQYGERREHGPVADFKLLIDVMEVHLDGAVGNIQPAPNFLVRQPFGHQGHDLALAVCQHRQHVFRDRDGPSILRYGLIGGGSGSSLWPSATCRKDCTRVSIATSFRMTP